MAVTGRYITIRGGILPSVDLEINNVNEGTFAAGSTVDVQLTDGTDPVTPDSVSLVGNTLTVAVPSGGVAPVGAALMKTGQTTSYRTGDDGDIEAGRDVDFFTLPSNNPFGNTNRFTDELGGSTYTNNWVIDWSTYDGSVVLGYFRVLLQPTSLGYATNAWNDMIDSAALETFGTFTACRLANRKECENLINVENASYLDFAPFTFLNSNLFTSSTNIANTAQSWQVVTNNQFVSTFNKTNNIASNRGIVCRTFTVTGTTLT
jgi:hypothetical protein